MGSVAPLTAVRRHGSSRGVLAAGYQRTVTGSCSNGSAIGSVSPGGAVTCNGDSVRPGISNLNLGGISLGAHACAIVEIPLSGIAVDDTAIIVPDAATWPKGLIFQVLRADQTSKIPLDVCNPTDASVSSPTTHLSIWLVKIAP
jgi:hypothetical protein